MLSVQSILSARSPGRKLSQDCPPAVATGERNSHSPDHVLRQGWKWEIASSPQAPPSPGKRSGQNTFQIVQALQLCGVHCSLLLAVCSSRNQCEWKPEVLCCFLALRKVSPLREHSPEEVSPMSSSHWTAEIQQQNVSCFSRFSPFAPRYA